MKFPVEKYEYKEKLMPMRRVSIRWRPIIICQQSDSKILSM